VPDYIDLGVSFEHSFYRWLFYFSPYARIFEFLLGCLTAHAFILLRPRPVSTYEQQSANLVLAISLASLIFFGALYLGVGNLTTVNSYIQFLALNFLCAPAIAFILFYVARYQTSFTKLLSSPVLVGLGDTSYSIYLIHTWTLRVFNHPAQQLNWIWGADAVFRILFGIAFTLLAAYATYRLIEVPSRVFLRKKLGRVIDLGFGSKPSLAAVDRSPTPRVGLLFSFGAMSILALIVVGGQAARSDAVWSKLHRLRYGDRTEISIVSATYGLNCKGYPERAPFTNWGAPGNVTKSVERACNLRQRCVYMVDTSTIGDPANGCGKDFSVEYRCTEPKC